MSPTAPEDLPQWLAPLSAAAAAITDDDSDWLGWRPRVRTLAGEPRQSAVLILFAEGGPGGTPGRPDVLLTERAATLRSHAGQPAFPGGRIDPGDRGPVGAALREAEEETGVDPAAVAVFGHLPELYLQPSDFMVASVLGWWRTPAPLRIGSPSEVAIVRRVPVDELSDPANRFRLRHPTGYVGSAFTAGGMLVWGFTAGLLDAVLRLGGWEREWDRSRIRELPAEMSAAAFPPGPAAGSSTMSPAEQRPYMQEPIGLRKPRGSA
ncbi:MAG TPA: CoA pyrophosphatase [Actinocrinis sp.]|nr:CoA pyrophosphatase [Actinocrinis sp.]